MPRLRIPEIVTDDQMDIKANIKLFNRKIQARREKRSKTVLAKE